MVFVRPNVNIYFKPLKPSSISQMHNFYLLKVMHRYEVISHIGRAANRSTWLTVHLTNKKPCLGN